MIRGCNRVSKGPTYTKLALSEIFNLMNGNLNIFEMIIWFPKVNGHFMRNEGESFNKILYKKFPSPKRADLQPDVLHYIPRNRMTVHFYTTGH